MGMWETASSSAIAELRRHLDEQTGPSPRQAQDAAPPAHLDKGAPDPIPTPPALYAEPPYIGSHEFVGRKNQIEILKDWSAPADPHPVLLFDSIGGAGKSILTW